MKKFLALFLALIMFSTSTVFAFPVETINYINESTEKFSEFQLDEVAIEEEFAELNALEDYLLKEDVAGVTLSAEIIHDKFGIENLSLKADARERFSMDEMDWGAFAWGLLCCPIGFFVVAINGNKTQDQKTSFWIGWGVGVAINLMYWAAGGYRNFY